MFGGTCAPKEVGETADGNAALGNRAEAFCDAGRELLDVDDSLPRDRLYLAPRLARQNSRCSGLVGYDFDTEGHPARSVMGTMIHNGTGPFAATTPF